MQTWEIDWLIEIECESSQTIWDKAKNKDKYHLENDVDYVVILSDDLQWQVESKGDSMGKCPDGK